MNKKAHSGKVLVPIGFAVIFLIYYINTRYNLLALPTLNLQDYLIMGLIIWAYSQMPDSDTPMSSINRYLNISGLIVIGYSFINGNKTLGLVAVAILLFVRMTTHRTMIHSLIVGLLFSAPLYFIKPIYAYVGLIAFIAHLLSENEFSIGSKNDWKLFHKG